MSASLFLILRILFAWSVVILIAALAWGGLFGGPGSFFWLLALVNADTCCVVHWHAHSGQWRCARRRC